MERNPNETTGEDSKDTEFERRSGFDAMHEVDPEPARERGMAVYGDTDLDPNRDDQKSAHHADADEHL